MFFTRNGVGGGNAFSSIWRRGPAVGVAMGVALSGVLGISAPARSWADVQAIDVRQYSIAPGDLAKALDMLASQGNLRIVYSPELVAGLATRGVSGRFAPDEVLGRLLAETELTWKAVNASTFILLRQKPPDQNRYNTASKHDGPAAVRTLDTVTISGSLIDSPQIQTATPIYTITTEDIKTRGFNSVAEALQNSVLATGSVEGPQRFDSFTQGAQTINLYGLGPRFSLILLDGKPLANFGRLYDGSSSFSNLSNIPVSMIDHIDVMPGGGSSIYGSQAVASVVNIVTRQHLDGAEVSVRTGRFDAGGGASQRISLGYAHAFGKLSAFAMMELDHTSPIWGYQRALTASASANPNGLATPQSESVIGDFGTAGFFTGQVKGYISPSAGCATNLFKGSTALSSNNGNPERYGQYCGSPYIDGYTTFSNQSRSVDGMLKLTYEVSDNVR
ncbi:MAG TPA: TonB-dependent receptor, partial [Rhodanobacter sp.]|nr:TonB-dependent receptor [Rhodanobacter sp.]